MANKKVFVLLVAILLFSLCLVYNISMLLSADNKTYQNNKSNQTKTTELTPSSDSASLTKIFINGEEKEIYVLELNSHLGFNINYEDAYFVPSRLSNGAIKITNKNDERCFVLIDKLQEKDYYKEYNELNTKEVLHDSYLVSYKFLKGNVLTYLKITKSININSQDYEELNARLDYIISSLVLTS